MFKKTVVLISLLTISATSLFAVQRVVLAEYFTGTWCPYCPSAYLGLANLKNQVKDSVTVLAYHRSDAFTVPEVNVRYSYYSCTGVPTVLFDGVLRRVGGYSNQNQPMNYRDLFDTRKVISAPVQITLSDANFSFTTGAGSVRINMNNVSSSIVEGNLRFVMVGKETTYAWQNQSKLYDVVLGMFPDNATGEPLSLNPGEQFSRSYNYTIPTAWRGMTCAIVAFLQNNTNKEVYNACELEARTGIEETHQELLSINTLSFANPVSKQVKFYFNKPITADLNLTIYDVSGQTVKTLNNFLGRNEITWDLTDTKGRKVKSGTYFIISEAKDQKFIHKLVVAK